MDEQPTKSNVGKTCNRRTDAAGTSCNSPSIGLRSDDYNVFNDPVHGHISLHPLLVKIIDTPQFQRLRNIKQLGGVYFVYPGASHNRFEHSIGVAHLAEKLARMLQQGQKDLDITEEDILCVTIAGLCHDLGHGPFSHLFDGMFLPEVLPKRKWKHEDGSCKMLDHLIKENKLKEDFKTYKLKENDILFIKEMIAGPQHQSEDENGWRYGGRTCNKSFLYEIVSNERNGVDVDKWDYFARDCHHLGFRNSFDHNRFMQFTKVLPSEDGQLQLCARDKEHDDLYEMFHSRSTLHQRACQHKTCVAIELMISKAFVEADKHIRISGTNGKLCKISECVDDLVAYTKLNDNIFYQILQSEKPELEPARQLLERVHQRKLFVCIGGIALQGEYTNENGIGLEDKKEYDVTAEDIVALDNSQPKTLEAGDILIRKTKINHGEGNENPVEHFRFFRKSDTDQAHLIPKEEISNMLPHEFEDRKLLIWCTSADDKKIEAAKKCWGEWKDHNPNANTLDPSWTPMKKENRLKDGNDDENPNTRKRRKLEFSGESKQSQKHTEGTE